jgi:hypothetical protein
VRNSVGMEHLQEGADMPVLNDKLLLASQRVKICKVVFLCK